MKWTWSAALIVICIAYALTITGCGGGGSDSGTAFWWGDSSGGGTAQTYSVSGTLRDSITNTPVQDATCTLTQTKSGGFLRDFIKAPKETTTVGTTRTGTDGTYCFTGIASGAYTLKFTKTDYITLEVSDLSVTGDTANVDRTVVQTSQWSQVAGSDAPYDATKDYVIVDASLPSKGARPAVSGVSAIINPSTGVRIGYFTDGTPPTINWNATGTSSNGRIIFYGLTPGVQYTITFNLPGYTFPTLNVSSPTGGGVVQSYNIYATSPTPTPTSSPTSSPTPSPSPSLSPTPSPSPTSGGGGGGGGGVPTYTVTYDGNGNTGGAAPTDNNKYQQGAEVTVLDNTGNLEKNGFIMNGWNTKADGSGTGYAANATFNMGGASVTLYANWITLSRVDVTSTRDYLGHRKAPANLGANGGAEEEQFTATAVYSDNSQKDVTADATWSATKWGSADAATAGSVSDAAGTKGKFAADKDVKYIEAISVKAAYGGTNGSKKLVVGFVEVPETTTLTLNETQNITINGFYAGQYEVTNQDFCEFLNDQGNLMESPSMNVNETWWVNNDDGYNGISCNGVYSVKNNYGARPVVYVRWFGAVAYCNWLSSKHGLVPCYGGYINTGADRWGVDGANYHPENSGYRLATEAEWEYACRINTAAGGVSTGNYYWTPDGLIGSFCWYNQGNHQDVGLLYPNGIGLYDMSGNVREWVSDWYGGTFPYDGWVDPGPYTNNPKGPKTGTWRVLRGGAWDNTDADDCKSGARTWDGPVGFGGGTGFRLVRTK